MNPGPGPGPVADVVPGPSAVAKAVARAAAPRDAAEITRLRSDLTTLLEHPERDGVTLYELHTSEMAASLYEQLGFRRDPALMRMTKVPPAAPQDIP
ncbi:hypothetical protein AB0E83_21400 [Streptomyces sp. NPDC035033]|uniref:GNAT family N-acetyltransferase n=1 Tax=Streptomyces sp. NPDC035033 TaxID=3155368 RepID=UPI0033E9FB2B